MFASCPEKPDSLEELIKMPINKDQYVRNGAEYQKIEFSEPVQCALTVNNEKFVLTGKPAIELVKNSWKYKDEVQVTVYNKIGSTKKSGRVAYATTYDRMEIFFPAESFYEMCKEFIKDYEKPKAN